MSFMTLTTITSTYGDISFAAERSGIDALKRLVGCLFVMTMPSIGLDETVVSLNDLREYWSVPAVQQPIAAAIGGFVAGHVARVGQRPDLDLGE